MGRSLRKKQELHGSGTHATAIGGGSGPRIYELEDSTLRWISSVDAFEHLGLTGGNVHFVLCDYLRGSPFAVLSHGAI